MSLLNGLQQELLDLSSLTSKMLRRNFGRGPESCHAYINHRYLVFYIRGFLSPMESVLLEKGKSDHIVASRRIVMDSVLTQLKGVFELKFQQDVRSFYQDWNYPNNTGLVTVVFEKDILTSDEAIESFQERSLLVEEVERISMLVQRKPEQTAAYKISPKIYLIIRQGILVPVEKALILKGYQQTLLAIKDELEKTYYHRYGRFEEIFNQQVTDIFVDWNFSGDNSIMCLVLK
jgi:uncharacterized protein YbcI